MDYDWRMTPPTRDLSVARFSRFGFKPHSETDSEVHTVPQFEKWKKSQPVMMMEARHLVQSLKHLDLWIATFFDFWELFKISDEHCRIVRRIQGESTIWTVWPNACKLCEASWIVEVQLPDCPRKINRRPHLCEVRALDTGRRSTH
jgi:hypothetical protein